MMDLVYMRLAAIASALDLMNLAAGGALAAKNVGNKGPVASLINRSKIAVVCSDRSAYKK
jgi:hypothetical protein